MRSRYRPWFRDVRTNQQFLGRCVEWAEEWRDGTITYQRRTVEELTLNVPLQLSRENNLLLHAVRFERRYSD